MIRYGNMELAPLTRYNWEEALALKLSPEQTDFMPENLYSLAQCAFEKWMPWGIWKNQKMVGMMITGEANQIGWIYRIMIDASSQNEGVGQKALQLMLSHLKSQKKCSEIRTTVMRKNIWALYLFESAGFKEMQESFENEAVLNLVF